ncbi:MAG: Crp/Fnr family transcriptional regulator [Actinobacteria bacterium]|nr:MAG: Crp/Fnr family transcriptional regulator [Actinomycetota bacterium]
MDPPTTASDASSFISRVREEQTLIERVELLEQAPLFSVLHPTDLRILASRFHLVRYGRGEVIFREGEPAERLFLIDSGRVKLSISSATGQELMIAVLGRGQIFGELEVIDHGTRAMDARAMEVAELYAFPSDVFWTMLENRPALARRLLELMARRLRRADQNSQDLVFFDAPTRLARRLIQLAEEHGEPVGADEESVKITVRVTQEELAQMIGVTRESANRLVASFAGRGWIEWNDGYPLILQPEALVRRAR